MRENSHEREAVPPRRLTLIAPLPAENKASQVFPAGLRLMCPGLSAILITTFQMRESGHARKRIIRPGPARRVRPTRLTGPTGRRRPIGTSSNARKPTGNHSLTKSSV